MIKFAPSLWLNDLSEATPPGVGTPRRIKRGPLLNLTVLQAVIASKQLNDQGVWPATRRCRNSLEDYGWNYDDVLKVLSCLLAVDYKKSEWCDVDGDRTVPCDVYTLGYDEVRRQRNPSSLEIYLKFSVDDGNQLTLVLVQSHFS